MNVPKNYKILTVLLVMQWAFVKLIAQYPSAIENVYSSKIYVVISKILQVLFGWIPFSLGDILYVILGILIIYEIIKVLQKKTPFKVFIFKTLAFFSILFFSFHFNWAINYFSIPINKKLGFENKLYTTNDLLNTTKLLVKKTNEIHLQLVENDSILYTSNYSKKEIRKKANQLYTDFNENYPIFKLSNYTVKPSLFSTPLTYMGFAGYLNPFTNEAQINELIPINNYAATMSHEIAHQAGIAPESEANFAGFLACTKSRDSFFQYSGYLMALRYCLNELEFTNPEAFTEVLKTINLGIVKDYERSAEFWQSYQNRTEKYFKWFYDNFLKFNNQEEGLESYNKMVPLVINFYKNK